jgi:hypothetical protein
MAALAPSGNMAAEQAAMLVSIARIVMAGAVCVCNEIPVQTGIQHYRAHWIPAFAGNSLV